MNKNTKTVVKVRETNCICGDGTIKTTDIRFNSKRKITSIVKYCIKHGFSFTVGFKDNTIISNKNYIEIYDNWFSTRFSGDEELFEKRYDEHIDLLKFIGE